MAVTANDLKYYLTGASSDGGVQADPNASLGNYRSSSEITSAAVDNLFDDVTSGEASSGDTEYRAFCIKNTSGSDLLNVVLWIQAETDPNADQTIYFAVEVPRTANLTDGYGQTLANESTAPSVNTTNEVGTGSGISDWSTATSKGAGVTPAQGAHNDDLTAGQLLFVFIKRVIRAGAIAQSNMSFTIRIEGDTL